MITEPADTAANMMTASNALRAIICVLIVLVLVLAALLLARRRAHGPRTAAALGGAFLLAAGPRPPTRGGAVGDLWTAATETVSTAPWNFPAHQVKAIPDLAATWDKIRAANAVLTAAMAAAYGADPTTPKKKGAKRKKPLGRTAGTWATTYENLDQITTSLEQTVDRYREDPPTTAGIRDVGVQKAFLTSSAPLRLGALRVLKQQMTGATGGVPGNPQDAVVRAADALIGLVDTLPPPVPLPALPVVDAKILDIASGGAGVIAARITAGHSAEAVAKLKAVADRYISFRKSWVDRRGALTAKTDPTRLDKAVSALGDQLAAVIAIYDQPPTAAIADSLKPAFDALRAGYLALNPVAPLKAPDELGNAIRQIRPIDPPPLGPPPPEVDGFDPRDPGLVGQHDAAAIQAVRDTVAAVAAMNAWYAAGKIRTTQGVRGLIGATDADVRALNAATVALIRAYTAVPPAPDAPTASAEAIRDLLAAQAQLATQYPAAPVPQITAVGAAAARLAPIVARAASSEEESSPSAPLTESQKLIHLHEAPRETLEIVETPAAVKTTRGSVVIEAASERELDAKIKALAASVGGHGLYGLVTDRPGDRVALLRAVAINLRARLPDSYKGQRADQARSASGWLYAIVRLNAGGYYKQLRDYIRPELYAINT